MRFYIYEMKTGDQTNQTSAEYENSVSKLCDTNVKDLLIESW